MTTYRITLRCFDREHKAHLRDYRIEAWTREDAIRKARDLAFLQGFAKAEVSYIMPAFIAELDQ